MPRGLGDRTDGRHHRIPQRGRRIQCLHGVARGVLNHLRPRRSYGLPFTKGTIWHTGGTQGLERPLHVLAHRMRI
jgi:hypothetical protein